MTIDPTGNPFEREPAALTPVYDLAHALETAFTQLDTPTQQAVAERILHHLHAHSVRRQPSTNYQFVLPNGALLNVADVELRGRRSLLLSSARGLRGHRQIIQTVQRGKNEPQDAPWAHAATPEKELKKLRKGFAYGVEVAFANRDRDRLPDSILIDPSTPPDVDAV